MKSATLTRQLVMHLFHMDIHTNRVWFAWGYGGGFGDFHLWTIHPSLCWIIFYISPVGIKKTSFKPTLKSRFKSNDSRYAPLKSWSESNDSRYAIRLSLERFETVNSEFRWNCVVCSLSLYHLFIVLKKRGNGESLWSENFKFFCFFHKSHPAYKYWFSVWIGSFESRHFTLNICFSYKASIHGVSRSSSQTETAESSSCLISLFYKSTMFCCYCECTQINVKSLQIRKIRKNEGVF